jgi:hypothetical protein
MDDILHITPEENVAFVLVILGAMLEYHLF